MYIIYLKYIGFILNTYDFLDEYIGYLPYYDKNILDIWLYQGYLKYNGLQRYSIYELTTLNMHWIFKIYML